MSGRFALQVGTILAALSVVFGAFAAHALKTRLEPAMLANVETAARYQMYIALALMILGNMSGQTRAPILLLSGAVLFSGSLYLMALTGQRWLGAVTPLGGLLMIAGFVVVAIDASQKG